MKGLNKLTSDKRMLEYEIMQSYSNISCFSTTRHGGCSKGTYATFNCTHYCGDEWENVRLNRERILEYLPDGVNTLVILEQTHSTNVKVLLETPAVEELKDVDAIVTQLSGHCLCVSTADCVPVMLFDVKKRVIAAIHAGWRGTVGRIVEKTLKVMNAQYGTEGRDVIACIGPSISMESFEVGDEVYDAFQIAGFDMQCIARKYEKWHIDLWEANRVQLLACGVLQENIEVSGVCTYQRCEDFFSARRLGIRSGRILSGIMLH